MIPVMFGEMGYSYIECSVQFLKGLHFTLGFSFAISTMGWMTSPLTTLTSIPTLTRNPLEFSDFLPQERLPLSYSKPWA